jgi:hypothetical protein
MNTSAKRRLDEQGHDTIKSIRETKSADVELLMESSKRSPWDLKGRLKDMEMLMEMLKDKIRNSETEISQVNNIIQSNKVSRIPKSFVKNYLIHDFE